MTSDFAAMTPHFNPCQGAITDANTHRNRVANPYKPCAAVERGSNTSVTPVLLLPIKTEEVNKFDIAGVTDAELIFATDLVGLPKSADNADQVASSAPRQEEQSVHSLSSSSANNVEEERRDTFRLSPVYYTAQSAFRCGAATAHKPLSGHRRKSYKFFYPRLTCPCVHIGNHIIVVGDESYLQSIENSTLWWDQEFVTAVSTMTAHYAHTYDQRNRSIVLPHLVNIITATNAIHESACKNIDPSVKRVVGVIHQVNHYAVMEINIKTRVARIYDGLRVRPLVSWTQHVINALQMCNQMSMAGVTDTVPDSPTQVNHPRTRNVRHQVLGYTLTIDHEMWRLEPGEFIAQTDGYNCGPIACLKLLAMYHLVSVEDVEMSNATGLIRRLVIEKWRRFVDYCDDDLVVRKRLMITMEEPYPIPGSPLHYKDG